jgi:cyclopropane-fatty-acyl-phospholipid synthase
MTSELAATKAVIAELARHLDVNISLELWDGTIIPLGHEATEEIRILLGSPQVLRRLLLNPSLVTIAELYAAGDLDLVGADPIDAMRQVDHLQFRYLPGKVNKLKMLRLAMPILLKSRPFSSMVDRFTRKLGLSPEARNDSELIQFHYDISNDFYELFLDKNMVYSSAYFSSPEQSLDDAQLAKLDLICRKLRLEPGDRFFDPGCGWGGLLCHAAEHYGVQAYGTTLSQEQHDYVTAKVARLGLQDRVTVELRDCRSLPDNRIFDKIAQVEMVEHIGIANHHEFYQYLGRHLRPRGLYFGQASARRNILNPDPAEFAKLTPYMRFIVDYIFPGGELDHIGMTCAALERAGFELHEVEALREHFGLTCEHWAKSIHTKREQGAALIGMPKTRLWLLYLSLCALSFQRGALNVFQVVASHRRVGASGVAFDRRVDYLGAKPLETAVRKSA